MKNTKKCTHNCPNCKFALTVENFGEQPYWERPTVFSNRYGDGETERQAMLGVYQCHTPTVTLCYLPEDMECNYEIRADKTLLSETHPQTFIEQMTDLYEGISLAEIRQIVFDEREKASTVGLDDREQLWHKIHLAIYERKTGHAHKGKS